MLPTKPPRPVEVDTAVSLMEYFDQPVILSFDQDIIDYILDYLSLVNSIKSQNIEYYDYSFVLLPLCKALEKHLFRIYYLIGFISLTPKDFTMKGLGRKMLNPERLNSLEEYLKRSQVDEQLIKKALRQIQFTADFWHNHRNLPLHADGVCIPNLIKAELTGSSILKHINDFTTAIAELKIGQLKEIFGEEKLKLNSMPSENINIREEVSVVKDDYVFVLSCREEVKIFLQKSHKENLDFLKFYINLHFVLEISLSQLFRQFVLFHVYLQTDNKELTINDMDKFTIQEKFNTLANFTSADTINSLSGWFFNFAEKRNKILHGHWIGDAWNQGVASSSAVKGWLCDDEAKRQLDFYHKIINSVRGIIDLLPDLKEQGKKDIKEILYTFN